MSDEITKSPETIEELIRWSSVFLSSKGFQTSRLDTELLLCSVLGCRRIDLYLRFDQPLSRLELSSFKSILIRRLNHEPIAYIIGYRDFMSLRFQVDPNVLIPRSETELLVERAIEFAKTLDGESLKVLEIGTGSGCIGISLLHYLAHCSLVGWDISPGALRISKANASACGIDESRLDFQQKDMLDENSWYGIGKFDIIICNPPYIGVKEKEHLARSVIEFEPEIALFAESDGLAFYTCLAEYAREHLTEKGRIFLEIGSGQANDVSRILSSYGWRDIELRKDYSRHDRIIEGYYESK
jgi:release factor glutamine methyltransferase